MRLPLLSLLAITTALVAAAPGKNSHVEIDSAPIPNKFARSEADGPEYMMGGHKKKKKPPQSRRWSLMDGESEDSLEGMCSAVMCFGG